jgi:hypothetical protein
MIKGYGRTSGGNIGNNAGGSGSIGNVKMLSGHRIFHPLLLDLPHRRPLTCDGKIAGTE